MKFKMLIKANLLKNKDLFYFQNSDFVFIMLLNVKMPTIAKFHAQLSWAWQMF